MATHLCVCVPCKHRVFRFCFSASFLAAHDPKASDGRLYRCDVAPALSNGALAAGAGANDETAATDDEDDWEEKEASRQHSVKFTDPQDTDNREVSDIECSLWSWLVGCAAQLRACADLHCCLRRSNLRRSSSYYMLNMHELALNDHIDDYSYK